MVDIRLSERDARRVALAAQGFADPRPRGRVDRRHFRRVLDRVATVQLDSVNVLTRSHELVFFSRLGHYDRDALSRWLWSAREAFEYWGHEASVHPVGRQPLLRWRMDDNHQWGNIRRAVADHPEMLEALHDAVRTRGPIGISALQALHGDGRRNEPWWGWSTTKMLMEYLFWRGEVTAVRRNGFTRSYLPVRDWLPGDVLDAPTPSPDDAKQGLLLVAARAHGVGTARDLADYYRLPLRPTRELLQQLVAAGQLLAVEVDGWKEPAYLHPEAKRPQRRLRAQALLSPFDSLIWERARTERIWGFRYRIEIYVPQAKRVHGYYVLPFLLGEDLVARVDLKADRQAGALRVRAAWGEGDDSTGTRGRASPFDVDTVAPALAETLIQMAEWLGLAHGVAVEPHGTLAPALAEAVGPLDATLPGTDN